MIELVNRILGKEEKKERFIILQWGIERSIIQEVTSNKFQTYIIGNQELLNIEERGNIV